MFYFQMFANNFIKIESSYFKRHKKFWSKKSKKANKKAKNIVVAPATLQNGVFQVYPYIE